MMKSWADHCSSDEDTDDNHSVASEEQEQEIENNNGDGQSLDDAFSEKVNVNDQDAPVQPQARTYDFPRSPPFTAFVGNLSYDIKESSQLQQALADVVFDRLGERVNVLGGRISYERNSNNHRGFGYVELETLEELKTVMKLNDDGKATLAGRKIQVDTANHQNNNRQNNNYNNRPGQGPHNNNHRGSFNKSFEKIDGSKFRGGKFNSNSNNNGNNNNSYRNNNRDRNSFQKGPSSGDAAPRQRPSLKLAPRSKPVDESDRSSSSGIFGGAKARDQQAWEKSRQQQQQAGDEKKKILSKKNTSEDNNNNKNNKSINNNKTVGKDNKSEQHQERRQSGRGGRGGKGGRGNRGGGRGDQNNRRGSGRRNSQNDKKQDKKQQKTEEKTPAAASKTNAKQTDAPPPNPEKSAPKNKFALLMDDSDSD